MLILDGNVIIEMEFKLHTRDYLRLDLDRLQGDGCWGPHSLRHPCMIAGFEMSRMLTVKTYMILITISLHMPSFPTLETPQLVTSKLVSSPTLTTYIIVPQTLINQLIYIELSTSLHSF